MTGKEKNSLWDNYIKTKNQKLREQLIIEYAPLVKVVAGRLSMYFGNNVEYEDLVSYGIIGLIDSIDKFDTKLNVKFETYANIRIRGSIIDQIRKLDWVPRAIRDKQKHYNSVENELSMKLGRVPTDTEMITELGVTEDEYYVTQTKILGTQLVYIDEAAPHADDNDGLSVADTLEQSTFESPESSAIKLEISDKLKEAISNLTDRERQVIELYYYEELTLKEISVILEVSEGRASQLHTKAIKKLKTYLGEYIELFYKTV